MMEPLYAYELLSEVAAGTTCTVLFVRDVVSGHRCVMKILKPELASDAKAYQFRREIDIL